MLNFTLDGFHNRTLDAWREEIGRVEIPARMVPAKRVGNRVQAASHVPAIAIVERRSWRASARRHAALHRHAGVWHADGSFTLFYLDIGRVRTKTWRNARPTP